MNLFTLYLASIDYGQIYFDLDGDTLAAINFEKMEAHWWYDHTSVNTQKIVLKDREWLRNLGYSTETFMSLADDRRKNNRGSTGFEEAKINAAYEKYKCLNQM